MFSDALASAVNNEQRFELKGMIEGYINKKNNLTSDVKEHLIETLHNSLPDDIDGGKNIKNQEERKSQRNLEKHVKIIKTMNVLFCFYLQISNFFL